MPSRGVAPRRVVPGRTASYPGPMGWVERLAAPRVLRATYADELRRLDEYARAQLATPAAVPTQL